MLLTANASESANGQAWTGATIVFCFKSDCNQLVVFDDDIIVGYQMRLSRLSLGTP